MRRQQGDGLRRRRGGVAIRVNNDVVVTMALRLQHVETGLLHEAVNRNEGVRRRGASYLVLGMRRGGGGVQVEVEIEIEVEIGG